jgi:hypothetical protein
MDMTNSHHSNIKIPLKKCWRVGNNTVVVIDKSIVERLGLDEENTIFQEEVAEGGILLRIIRQEKLETD